MSAAPDSNISVVLVSGVAESWLLNAVTVAAGASASAAATPRTRERYQLSCSSARTVHFSLLLRFYIIP